MSVRIAVWTYFMRGFGAAGIFLNRIGKHSGAKFCEFIFGLFSVPFFKASNFFFEIVYTLQQRELIRLGGECVRLGGEDYSLQFDNRLVEFREISVRYRRLCHLARRS